MYSPYGPIGNYCDTPTSSDSWMDRYEKAMVESTGVGSLKPIYNRQGEVVGYMQDGMMMSSSTPTTAPMSSTTTPPMQTVPTENEQWNRRPAVAPSCPNGQCGWTRNGMPQSTPTPTMNSGRSCADQCSQTSGCLGWSQDPTTGACSMMYGPNGANAMPASSPGPQAEMMASGTPRFWSVDGSARRSAPPAMPTASWGSGSATGTGMLRDPRRLGFN